METHFEQGLAHGEAAIPSAIKAVARLTSDQQLAFIAGLLTPIVGMAAAIVGQEDIDQVTKNLLNNIRESLEVHGRTH